MSLIDLKFIQHVSKFGLSFASLEEFNMRKAIFEINDAFIEQENADPTHTYKAGHNILSTWTDAERAKLTQRRSVEHVNKTYVSHAHSNQSSVNWVTAGCVTPVKNQGQCGSCWAFSSTGALEGAHCIKAGPANLLSFSEQQLVDCAGLRWGNFGCNGGLQQYAFNYYMNGGNYAMSEAAYPYTGVDGTCVYNASNTTGVTVTSWAWTTPQVATGIQAALNQQPQSISIQANQLCFQMYSSGVFNNTKCGTNLDHAVLMVGYATDPSAGPYWLVKNSWGTGWGENGYI
jgi:C1A family cysteine protease